MSDASSSTKKRPQEPEVVYHIHSLVRDVSTRLDRARSPVRHRFSQMLGGGLVRLIRKRPQPVLTHTLLQLLPELKQKEALGYLKVTTHDGRRINLDTLQVVSDTPGTPALPEKLVDVVEKDETFPGGVGQDFAQMPGALPRTAEPAMPVVLKEIPEGTDEVPEVEVTAEAELSSVPDEIPQTVQSAPGRRRGRR